MKSTSATHEGTATASAASTGITLDRDQALARAQPAPRALHARAAEVAPVPTVTVRAVTTQKVAPTSPRIAKSSPSKGLHPPTQGLGLLLPETPAEMRTLIERSSLTEATAIRFARVRRAWAGVTFEDVREAVYARAQARWNHWGPWHPNGAPWAWQVLDLAPPPTALASWPPPAIEFEPWTARRPRLSP